MKKINPNFMILFFLVLYLLIRDYTHSSLLQRFADVLILLSFLALFVELIRKR